MSTLPKISGIIARQVGSIQGKVTAQVQNRVLEILSKFTSQCPTDKQIQQIISQKNNLLRTISSFERRIDKLRSTVNKFDPIIRSTKTAIRVIKSIPLPTAIIPTGGGIGIPIRVLTTYSDALIRLNKFVDSLEADKQGVLGIINSTSGVLVRLRQSLERIDIAIQECSKESPNLSSIVLTSQPKGNTGTEGTPIDPLTGEVDPRFLYKGYTLVIIQDPDSPQIAPRRYAIAKDRRGIVVLKGQSSFSSSTDVLLDEIKFRIDNQLP